MAKLEVILLESNAKLGTVGEVVTVRAGYARNFLLPQRRALRATEHNRKVFEQRKENFIKENADKRDRAILLQQSLADLKLEVTRQASSSGQLYGSVTAREIGKEIQQLGHPIEQAMVRLPRPIKALGAYTIVLELFADITQSIQLDVISAAGDKEERVIKENFNWDELMGAREAKAESSTDAETDDSVATDTAAAESGKSADSNSPDSDNGNADGKADKDAGDPKQAD